VTSATAVSDMPHASARSANGQTDVTALERRISELEQLATSQSRELRIQFERIAQLQAEWDIVRIHCIKS
jgi:hypothetical protein